MNWIYGYILTILSVEVYSKASFPYQYYQPQLETRFNNYGYSKISQTPQLPGNIYDDSHYLDRSVLPFYSKASQLTPYNRNYFSSPPHNLHGHFFDFSSFRRPPYSPVFILVGNLENSPPLIKRDEFAHDGINYELVNHIKAMEREEIPKACSFQNYLGQCKRAQECFQSNGRPTSYCSDFRQFCCLIFKTCSETSNEMSIYYRNKRYPFADQLQSTCGIEIQKRSSDVCFLKISPIYLNIPQLSFACDEASLGISGVPGKEFKPLCGYLNGASFVVSIQSATTVNLHVKSSISVPLQWLIHVQQVLCSSPIEENWPFAQGEITVRPTTAQPVTQPPTTTTTSTDSTVTQLSRCGIPNIQRKSQIGNRGQIPLHILDKQSPKRFTSANGFSSQKQVQSFRQFYRSTGENSLLQNLEWSGPTLNDTLFYEVAGNPSQLTGRITFGKETQPHQYPWAVAMFRSGRFHCGASLISKKHILTAAHCVQRYQNNPNALRLSLGDWNIDSNSDGPNVIASLSKIVVHPNYSTRTLQNDIAVLTMSKPVTFSRNLSPICLPSIDIPLTGKIVTVSGWGRNENNRLQSVLMEHSAVALSTEVCNRRWSSFGSLAITDRMLCMDTQDGDSCKGDSGGPTIMEYPSNSGQYVQAGLVSFGSSSCTDKKLPGVYTKVTKYIDWINSLMI